MKDAPPTAEGDEEAEEEAALTPEDGLVLLARLIADDLRRGGGRGGAPAQALPSPVPAGRKRGPYKPRQPIHCIPVTTRRQRAR